MYIYRYSTHYTITDEELVGNWLEKREISDEEAEALTRSEDIKGEELEEVLSDLLEE